MKKLILSMIAVILLSLPDFAKFSNGSWSRPFHPGVGNIVIHLQSTGDYIWFTTDNGIGRLNTVSQTTNFFSYRSLNLNINTTPDESSISVGDSNHFAFFGNDGPNRAYCYDGTVWKEVIFPDYARLTSVDKWGNVWIVPDEDDNGDNKFYFYDSHKWDTISPGLSDSDYITSMLADTSGVIWFSYNYKSSSNTSLGRYDRLSDSLVTFDSLSFNKIIMDPHNNIWLIGDSLMYSVTKDQKNTSFSVGTKDLRLSQCIDTDGNLWRLTVDGVTKIDPHFSNAILWKDENNFYGCPLYSCNNGVYVLTKDGFVYHKNNDTSSSFIPLDSIWGNTCGEIAKILLFKKDGSILYQLNNYFLDDGSVLEYKNGHCRQSPLSGYRVTSVCDMADGTLVASYDNYNYGLNRFNGSTWEQLPGTENIIFSNLFVDRNGKIWSILDTKIIRQTNSGWELIDHNNSNLPAFGQHGVYLNNSFIADSDGAIWALLDSSIVKTFDGYNWTIYNAANSKVPEAERRKMYVNQNGNIQLLYFTDENSMSFTDISRATFTGGDWHFETIKFPGNPFSRYKNGIYQDSRGNIFATSGGPLYCYDISDSTWTRLDTTSIPYNIEGYLGDDKKGKFYFLDSWGETVVFDYNGTPVLSRKNNVSIKPSLTARATSTGILSVEYDLPKPEKISLKVFSLNGKLVRTLFEGIQQKGSYNRSFNSGMPHGVYFVRLKTSDNSLVTRVVLR